MTLWGGSAVENSRQLPPGKLLLAMLASISHQHCSMSQVFNTTLTGMCSDLINVLSGCLKVDTLMLSIW